MSYHPRFHVVLYQPEIPPNTGAVGRTCVALRAKLWLVRPLGFRVDDATLRRAGLDYWQHLQWQAVDHWEHLLREMPDSRMWFFTKTADREFTSACFRPDDALVFGSETSGLPSALLERSPQQSLRIPTSTWVRSLNLSCSVAVAGYEVDRQLHVQHAITE